MNLFWCEWCGGLIQPDDVAPVKLPNVIDGKTYQRFLHNRHNEDCLSLRLEALQQYFASQDAAPQL